MRQPLDQREREELCDLLLELGPDASTLCEGWTTADIAAHLVLRERLKRWSGKRMAAEKSKGLLALVEQLRRGGPVIPWRVPGLRTLMNGVEYFIHHEDVRRANGLTRRPDRPDLDVLSWRVCRIAGWRLARQVRPFGLALHRPSGEHRRFGSGASAILSGEPTELLLYLTGRRAAAEAELKGPPDAVAAVERANLSQ